MAVTLILSSSPNANGSLRSRRSRLEADAFALADEKRVCPFVRPGQWRAILCAWDPVTHLHLRFRWLVRVPHGEASHVCRLEAPNVNHRARNGPALHGPTRHGAATSSRR